MGNDELKHKYIEITLLAFTVVAAIGFLARSLATGDDIPQGWAMLIGSAWGGLLGVKELARRFGGGDRG